MLRAATGDTAGRTTQGQGARRAAGGVGGAVGPPTPGRVAAEHPEARPRPPSPGPDAAPGGPVAAPRPGGPPGPCHLARGARISWAGTVQTRVVREARASGPEAWTAAGAPRCQPGWDRRMQRRKACGSSGYHYDVARE